MRADRMHMDAKDLAENDRNDIMNRLYCLDARSKTPGGLVKEPVRYGLSETTLPSGRTGYMTFLKDDPYHWPCDDAVKHAGDRDRTYLHVVEYNLPLQLHTCLMQHVKPHRSPYYAHLSKTIENAYASVGLSEILSKIKIDTECIYVPIYSLPMPEARELFDK